MASIEKRQTKQGIRYRARITLKGHPRISETFKSRREAQRWAERTTEAIRQRQYQPESEPERRTVGELIDRYIEERIPQLSMPRHNRRKMEWWRDQLGADTKLSQVTPEMIARCRDALAAGAGLSGKPMGIGSVKRYLALLSGALTTAVKDYFWMESNPCRKVRRPPEPRGRVRCLDDDERKRLLDACKAHRAKRLYPLVVMALCTGARQAELTNLRWTDVDLKQGVAILQQTKNGERRTLAITGLAETVMAEWYRERRLDTDLVFPSELARVYFPRKAWVQAVEASGVEDFRFHDLRHTFASYLAMSGATLAELAEALGHKSLAMVKRYAHLTEGHTASVIARMTSRFVEAA